MKSITGKLVVLGSQDVGKTSLIIRYVNRSFNTYVSPTIGASFFTCKFNLQHVFINLQIWDTAGQERFRAMAPMFYRKAHAALLVYDITQPHSFESLKNWVTELRRNVEEPMCLCVVGNKLDLFEQREVSRDEGLQYANAIGASYFECSAKEDQGLEQIFEDIARGILRLTDNNLVSTLQVLDDQESALVASSSELTATDVGRIEEPSWANNSVAHADSVWKPKCC